RRLFAYLPLKADIRLDHELRAERPEPRRERFPLIPCEHDAEVRHGHVMTVDGIAVHAFLRSRFRVLVDYELMAEEIEVDPLLAGAAFFEPEHAAVEVARGGEVVDGNGQMKRRKAH